MKNPNVLHPACCFFTYSLFLSWLLVDHLRFPAAFFPSSITPSSLLAWQQAPAWGFPGGSVERTQLPVQQMWVWPLSREDPLEKEMTTRSSILAWESPWAEEPVLGTRDWTTTARPQPQLCSGSRPRQIRFMKTRTEGRTCVGAVSPRFLSWMHFWRNQLSSS